VNIIAIDIGNTNITLGLFIENDEVIIEKIAGENFDEISVCLKSFWQKIPFVKTGKDKDRHDGVIVVASVKAEWTEKVREAAKNELNEKVLEIGVDKDVPLPMELDVDEPAKVGVDRVLCAFAAYSVVGDAVVVADFGTAVTIDLVSPQGVFLGGTILPGFDISADALNRHTAALPKIDKVQTPGGKPFGRNTAEAINHGLYYSAIGALETITRHYSEHIGRWPQTVVTGGNMEIVRSGCDFADSFVTDLGVKGIVLAYKKFAGEKE
jgi:type III pantothenate kinase